MVCYLHIGVEKTGTTTIQEFLYANKDLMKKKGYCFIQSIGSKNHWDLAFLGYNLDKSDSYTINRNLYSKREIILHKKKILAKLKNELRDSNVNNIIFSSELLHSRLNSKREIRRLRRILLIMGISDVRIICYIRHPFEMLPSLYSEALKRDELNEIKLYEINASINYSDGYKKKLSHFAYICNYKNSLQKWISVFNKDKIIVRLFDKNEFYQGDLLKDFILCIKLQWDVNFLVPTLQNKSLNLIGIELLRRINKILPQYMFYKKNNYRGDIALFIQKHFSFSDSQLKFYPTKKDMYYFCEYFKKSNEWIRKEFFPLKKNIFYDDKILSYQENDKLKTIDSRYLSQIVNFIVDIIVHKNIDIINTKNSIKEKDDAILKHKSHINSIEYILSKNKIEIIRIQNLNNTLNQTIKEKDNIINSNINHINQLQSNIQEKSTQLNQIQSKLSFQTKYGTAKTRIQNQLSYKLGQAMVVNSKSLLGYLIMPIALLSIMISHKQEQKIYQEKIKKDSSLKLPPLESYPDYKEALKLKNHLSYKLGQALIKANKTWYKGGYVKILFEVGKLKREYKNKKI